MLQTQKCDRGANFLRSRWHAGEIHTKSTTHSFIFRQSVNQMFLHICPRSQFEKLERGEEVNSLSETENNSVAGSLLAPQMLRRLQDQQHPSAAHQHTDDKLKLSHQCSDGRTRGNKGQEDQMSRRGGWRREEKIDDMGCGDERERWEIDEMSGKWPGGGEEMRSRGSWSCGRGYGGEEGWMWDRYINFLWAISPERNARKRKWAADKGKCVSLRFGQLWIGQAEFLWKTFCEKDYTDETSMLPLWFYLGSENLTGVIFHI